MSYFPVLLGLAHCMLCLLKERITHTIYNIRRCHIKAIIGFIKLSLYSQDHRKVYLWSVNGRTFPISSQCCSQSLPGLKKKKKNLH